MTNNELQALLARFDGDAEVILSALISPAAVSGAEEHDGKVWLS